MANSELPEGWVKCKLADVLNRKNEKWSPEDGGDHYYLSLKHIEKGTGRIISYGSSSEVDSSKTVFSEGDVLYGKLRPYLNKVARPSFDGVCSTDILVFSSSPLINNNFLKHRLRARDVVKYADQNSSGINLPRISPDDLGEFEIGLPPLREQRRIADRLDAIQSRTKATGEALAQVPDRIEEYRHSVLNAAFTGRLTADWREDHSDMETGEVLLERILDERHREWKKNYRAKYEAKGKKPPSGWKSRYSEPVEPEKYPDHPIPDSWEWSGMNTVFQWSNGDSLTKDEQEDGPYHVYGGNGVKGSHTDYMVEEETVVIGRVGANCGNVHLAEPESWITDNAIYADWQSSLIDEEFIVRQLRHLRLNRIAGGSGQPYISQKKLNSLAIALPPYDEQAEISRRIRQRLDKIDEMARHVEQARERLHHLDRSVLAKAFRGELVETEADRAHRENRDYETAGELLTRVKQKTTRDTDTTSPKSDGEKTARMDENGQIEMKVVEDGDAEL